MSIERWFPKDQHNAPNHNYVSAILVDSTHAIQIHLENVLLLPQQAMPPRRPMDKSYFLRSYVEYPTTSLYLPWSRDHILFYAKLFPSSPFLHDMVNIAHNSHDDRIWRNSKYCVLYIDLRRKQ